MAKKHRKQDTSHPTDQGISRRGWKIIGAGIAVLVLGYIVLGFTDPRGTNWASTLSPFLILGGYAVVGAGIMTPDPEEEATRN